MRGVAALPFVNPECGVLPGAGVGVATASSSFTVIEPGRLGGYAWISANIYSIGDVSGQPILVHEASKAGEVVAEIIAGHMTAKDWVGIPGAYALIPKWPPWVLRKPLRRKKASKSRPESSRFRRSAAPFPSTPPKAPSKSWPT